MSHEVRFHIGHPAPEPVAFNCGPDLLTVPVVVIRGREHPVPDHVQALVGRLKLPGQD